MNATSPFNAQHWAEELHPGHLQMLQSQLLGGLSLFVLIDPMLGDPLVTSAPPPVVDLITLNQWRTEQWQRPCHTLSLPADAPLRAEQAPYLVTLQDAADPHLSDTLAWALEETLLGWQAAMSDDTAPVHRMGGWLESRLDGSQLAEAISQRLAISTSAPTQAKVLRIADRRVWGLLKHVIGEAALEACLQPVARWHCLEMGLTLSHCSAANAPQAQQPKSPWLRFSREQWALMSRGEVAHRRLATAQAKIAQTAPTPQQACLAIAPEQWNAALSA